MNFETLRPISAISSLPFVLTETVKSPPAIAVMTFVISLTGLIATCVTRSTTMHMIKSAMRLTIAMMILRFERSAKTMLDGIYETRIQSVPSIWENAVKFSPSVWVE